MYAWIWRHIPGQQWQTRVAIAVGLALAAVLVLWYLAFPWLESRVHFDRNTVEPGTTSATVGP